MQANPDKFQLLLLKPDRSDDKFPKEVYITDVAIPRCCNVKRLGVNIDERLTFDVHVHIETICLRASRQLKACIGIQNYMNNHFKHDMHMALFRVRDGFVSAQVSEIFHEPLGE